MQAGTGVVRGVDDLPRAELEELRRGLLPMFAAGTLSIILPWGIFLAWRPSVWRRLDGAALALVLAGGLACLWRNRYHGLACWLFVSGLILSLSLVVRALPDGLTMAFGILVVVAGYALLGTWQALLAGLTTWGAGVLAYRLGAGVPPPSSEVIAVATLYTFAWGASCVAGRPLRASAEIALEGWSQTRMALAEARERRGELHRVVRALEEATYRIERMNNELLLARQVAETARANKARFAAIVSHELRGPLNLILGFSRLMALSPENYGVPLPDAYRADVDTIFENSEHLVSLINDILDLSQVEVDKLPLTRERIDVAQDVIGDVVATVRPLIERKNLYLHLETGGNLPPILADRARLRQVLLNLLTNAVRFTEKGGITIRLSACSEGLLISIADTGRGITAEQMPRLFEEFQQLQMTDGPEKGSGLGLAISKHIVELHGGRIWAESIPGAGTTFHLTLPLPSASAVTPGAAAGSRSIKPSRDFDTCLVVHDDPAAVRLLARHIKGYRIVGLADEREALALTRELHPRAIITTPELCAGIQAKLSGASLDVPVLSCDVPHLEVRKEQAILSYLMKPLTPGMVHAAMRRIRLDTDITVLLVDDEPDAVRLLESMLRSLPRPYSILKAYSGAEALEVMQSTVPDVVFMDLRMPEMDGEQVIAHMRADARLCSVPVVIVSARDAEDHGATLGPAIELRYQRPIDMARGARYLVALLDVVTPSYLPDPTAPESPAATAPG